MKKYAIILFDGMADYPDERGLTPMAEAHKPNTDRLAECGEVGLVRTVPDGMKPGSDVANLAVLGYDPKRYYTGRSPLEALAMGVEMTERDVSYRCNLVSLAGDGDYESKVMLDYSAGEITTAEAAELIDFLKANADLCGMELYAGVSYRHCLLRRGGETGAILTPPHDISDKPIADFLPTGRYGEQLTEIMKRSYKLLASHPINLRRKAAGKHTADSMWLWGEGRKPLVDRFYDLHGLRGAIVSAVDLVRGVGIAAGMTAPVIEGATGTIDSDFAAKARTAEKLLETHDLVYIHLEAPDECGHQGNYSEKRRAIELIDEKIVAPTVAALNRYGDYTVAILPDHATPVRFKTHVGDPVPYLIYDSAAPAHSGVKSLCEATAKNTGVFVDSGVALMRKLLSE